MSSDGREASETAPDPSETDRTVEELTARIELLTEENRRLREEYVRSRRASYRRTALGLFVVGAVAVAGGAVIPDARTTLFALGAAGIFGAILTYYLTPERLLAASTGEEVYAALAATGERLVAELGLQDDRVYVPAATAGEFGGVRLFVPHRENYELPPRDRLDSLFVVTDDDRERGLAVPPCGGSLFREFESSMTDAVSDDPAVLADQLADGLVEGFELANSARPDADPDGGRITVEVARSAYGSIDRFDHPVPSFLGVGVAAGLSVPVAVAVTDGDEDSRYVVTCEWDETVLDDEESTEDAPDAGSGS